MRLWKGKIKMLWAILSTLLVGAVAGWLASKIMGGGGSLVRNIAVGVIGSCVGGLLFGLDVYFYLLCPVRPAGLFGAQPVCEHHCFGGGGVRVPVRGAQADKITRRPAAGVNG